MSDECPVITIDGPSGAGKGTICQWLAQQLGWHLLDSGALYRSAAWAVVTHKLDLNDISEIIKAIQSLEVEFDSNGSSGVRVLIAGQEISDELRTEQCAKVASTIAAIPQVREVLLDRQQQYCRPPGLVADGRDMGTVVFPNAELKIYLTASADERAKRRYKQLKDKGISANLADLFNEIEARDLRDSHRKTAPLKAADDAVILDTTKIPIQAVCEQVFTLIKENGLKDTL